MHDIHCHIVPGVDDGSSSMEESLAMLDAAVEAGVTSMVCTPHCRDPYFDYELMCVSYEKFVDAAHERYPGFPFELGFEVNYRYLSEIGFEWVDRLGFEDNRKFLLELSTHAHSSEFAQYERFIFDLQSRGFEVIIAHPERYRLIQDDLDVASQLVNMGCKLQASADFLVGGHTGDAKKPGRRMFKEGLYSYLASDAHSVEHYRLLAKAIKKYGDPSDRDISVWD
jgi:protein-tyrosine phosphatase